MASLSSQTDHQVIRALGRNTQKLDHNPIENNNNLDKNLDKNITESISIMNNLKTKIIKTISTNKKEKKEKKEIIFPLNPTNLSVLNQQEILNKTKKYTINHRSNSINSIYNHNNNKNNHHQHQHIESSSTDSIHTHSTNQIRIKLERKLTQITQKLNYHNNNNNHHHHHHNTHHKSKSQSNLNHLFYSFNNNNNQPKFKSSSSSSLSGLFAQSLAVSHSNKTENESHLPTKLSTAPINERPKKPSQLDDRSSCLTSTMTSHHHQSQQDHQNLDNILIRRGRRNQTGKITPHTIYCPIEYDPVGFISSHPLHSISNNNLNNLNKHDNRISPTQAALSRLDEILSGHHQQQQHHHHHQIIESKDYACINGNDNIANFTGYQPITNPNLKTNKHNQNHLRSSSFSSSSNNNKNNNNKFLTNNFHDLAMTPHSLSPPVRSRKKNQIKSNNNLNSSSSLPPPQQHQQQQQIQHSLSHSLSLNDNNKNHHHHHHHTFIDPETWKSISISAPKFRHHLPITSID